MVLVSGSLAEHGGAHGLQLVEYFAGCKSITRGGSLQKLNVYTHSPGSSEMIQTYLFDSNHGRHYGLKSASFEFLDDNERQNFVGGIGYLNAVAMTMSLAPSALQWGAP
eukprot:5421605-Alexandrium_andersonii.AAC.1